MLLAVPWSVPLLAYYMARVIMEQGRAATQSELVARIETNGPIFIHYGVELALGIWLFFGSKRLAAWWWRLRHPELPTAAGGDLK